MSICNFIFTINISKLSLSQNDHNLTITNYWQRWHMKNKAPLMLFTLGVHYGVMLEESGFNAPFPTPRLPG